MAKAYNHYYVYVLCIVFLIGSGVSNAQVYNVNVNITNDTGYSYITDDSYGYLFNISVINDTGYSYATSDSNGYNMNINVTQYIKPVFSNSFDVVVMVSKLFPYIERYGCINVSYNSTYTGNFTVYVFTNVNYILSTNSSCISLNNTHINKTTVVGYVLDTSCIGTGTSYINVNASLYDFTVSWYNDSYDKRKPIVVYVNNVTDEIHIDLNATDMFNNGLGNDCSDLSVVLYNGTHQIELPIDIDYCDPVNKNISLYINHHTGDPFEMMLYLYYDNNTEVSPKRYSHTNNFANGMVVDDISMYSDSANLCFITQQAFDFYIDVTPSHTSVAKGYDAYFNVHVSHVGTPQQVYLNVSGIPSNSTYDLGQTTIIPDGTTTLRIHTHDDTPVGNYTITVCGYAGLIQKCDSATLEVKEYETPEIMQLLSSEVFVAMLILGSIGMYVSSVAPEIGYSISALSLIITAIKYPTVMAIMIVSMAMLVVYAIRKLLFG